MTDKSPFTTLEQLDEVKARVTKTGQKYMVYYSERLHSESGFWAGELVENGAIGDVLQVLTQLHTAYQNRRDLTGFSTRESTVEY